MARPRALHVLAVLVPLAGAPALASEAASRFHCQVTGIERLAAMAPDGGAAELSRFTCRVKGGPLDGFVATGTNLWGGRLRDGLLLGSLVVARKAHSVVVYEVQQVTRRARAPGSDARSWEGQGTGVYKLATGAVAHLAGKSFHSIARSAGPGAFTIETVVGRRLDPAVSRGSRTPLPLPPPRRAAATRRPPPCGRACPPRRTPRRKSPRRR